MLSGLMGKPSNSSWSSESLASGATAGLNRRRPVVSPAMEAEMSGFEGLTPVVAVVWWAVLTVVIGPRFLLLPGVTGRCKVTLDGGA